MAPSLGSSSQATAPRRGRQRRRPDVNGNGAYSVTYTTLATDPVGTYTFVANYGGNLPNTTAPATTNTCASPGANETVTVTGTVSSATQQRWLPNDRIVLTTNGGTLNGTLTATLYSGLGGRQLHGGTATVSRTSVHLRHSPGGVNDPSGRSTRPQLDFFVGTNPNGYRRWGQRQLFWIVHCRRQAQRS